MNYKGYTINIKQDEDPESPREWSNVGTMICWHDRYSLGDIEESKKWDDGAELLYRLAGIEPDEDKGDTSSREEVISKIQKNYVILPLYLYDHSGISMSVGSFVGRVQHAEWDSGQVGWIYAHRDTIINETTADSENWKEVGEDILKGEVRDYDTYIRGDIVGFEVEDKDGNFIDSCWSYYTEEDAIDEAKTSIDNDIKAKLEEHLNKLKQQIKHKVPFTYRKHLEI